MEKLNQERLDDIITDLEGYNEYTDVLYRELKESLEKSEHNINNSFYYFVFCIDFAFLYDASVRLTIYDIYYKTGEKQFKKAYFELKKLSLFGDITDIRSSYEKIIGAINEGLKGHNIEVDKRKKGLYEFFKNFLNKIVNVDYEITDYKKSYLEPISIKNRFVHDIYGKFIDACKCAYNFNVNYKDILSVGLKISNNFFLHILLRHYGPLKVFTKYHKNPIYKEKIKNGIGKSVDVTAFTNKDGTIVISEDGEFPSTKLNGNKDYLCDDLGEIIEVIKNVLPILVSNIKPERSPNIIYFDKQLYGVEFNKNLYREENQILVESIYPLNSEWQIKHGISKYDIDYIINVNDIPSDFVIKLENKLLNT